MRAVTVGGFVLENPSQCGQVILGWVATKPQLSISSTLTGQSVNKGVEK